MPDYGETIVVKSWEELQTALYLDDFASNINRNRSSYVFRGLDDAGHRNLLTSLNRQGEAEFEKHLLRNFIKYSKIDDDSRSVWKWLALAQHHGLPTRLLDWTYSPLVATHFAVSNHEKYDRDGLIWAVNYVDSKKYLPDQLVIQMDSEGSYIFTDEMLSKSVRNLETLSSLKNDAFALFFEPPSLDERIVNQYAVFSMMSDPRVVISDWIKDKEIRWHRIRIPKKCKWMIRDRLDQANVTERVLFPGLDGVATWLKRHYKDIRRKNSTKKSTKNPRSTK
jgi:hypothetical protein